MEGSSLEWGEEEPQVKPKKYSVDAENLYLFVDAEEIRRDVTRVVGEGREMYVVKLKLAGLRRVMERGL